ncbi:MAG TPA: MFS transporter [Chloroflexota bacterium]|nr:MFS transporter [Chloroflexota bacterium]
MKDSLPRFRWVALALAMLSQTSSSFILSVLTPIVPLFQSDLGISKAEVGLLFSATSVGAWSVVLLAGYLTDRFGIRKVMSTALMVAGSMLLCMAAVGSFVQAMVVMFVAGMFRGPVFPSSTKAVLTWFPPQARATAMGVKQMGLPVSGVVAATILPGLGLALGWRSAVAIPGLLIILAGVTAAVFYRAAPGEQTMARSSVGFKQAMGVMIRNRMLLMVCLLCFCFLVVQLAMISYLAVYFKEVALLDTFPDESSRIIAAGGFLAVCQIGGAIARVGWGAMSDRLFHGRRAVVLAIVGALTMSMSVLFASLGPGHPLWALGLSAFCFGVTAVGWNGVYNALLTETVGSQYAATGVGLTMTLTELGTISGPPLFGLVLDVTASYQVAWLFLAVMAAIGTLAALQVTRMEKPVISR